MGVGKDPNGLAPLVNQISRLLVRAIKILDPCGLAPWVSEIMFHKLRAKPAYIDRIGKLLFNVPCLIPKGDTIVAQGKRSAALGTSAKVFEG